MIYPSLHHYVAPYRAPRSLMEINNVFTSIKHDANLLSTEANRQKTNIEANIKYILSGEGRCFSTFNPVSEIKGREEIYTGIDEMIPMLSELDDKIKYMLNNI